MNNYLELLRAAGRYIEQIRSSLKSLDHYLSTYNYNDKELTESILSSWMASKKVKKYYESRYTF
jgi:hypothetical protein